MEIKHSQTVNDGQFSLYENDDLIGYIKYEWAKNGNINATGTFVDESKRGQNLGQVLFDELLEFAEQNDVKIYPICPYIVKVFKDQPDLKEFLDEEYLESLESEEEK